MRSVAGATIRVPRHPATATETIFLLFGRIKAEDCLAGIAIKRHRKRWN